MRGLSLQEVGVAGVLYGGTQAPGVATCVRARACSMRASARHSIALYSSSQHTHKRKLRDIHTVAAQASVVP